MTQSIDLSTLELQIWPSPILSRKAEAFELPLPDNIEEVVEIMLSIMYNQNGIGLAGPQANLSQRIIVYDLSEKGEEPEVMINPKITYASKKTYEEEEGCLSFPELRGYVKRSEKVHVEGLTIGGEEVEIEAEGLLSVLFQHEIDHLDGITFVDRLSPTGKMSLKRELKELERLYTVG